MFRSVAGIRIGVREESPGSVGRSASENRSHWRQWDMAEENDRRAERGGKGEKVV